jgi:hypothetical protein
VEASALLVTNEALRHANTLYSHVSESRHGAPIHLWLVSCGPPARIIEGFALGLRH